MTKREPITIGITLHHLANIGNSITTRPHHPILLPDPRSPLPRAVVRFPPQPNEEERHHTSSIKTVKSWVTAIK